MNKIDQDPLSEGITPGFVDDEDHLITILASRALQKAAKKSFILQRTDETLRTVAGVDPELTVFAIACSGGNTKAWLIGELKRILVEASERDAAEVGE